MDLKFYNLARSQNMNKLEQFLIALLKRILSLPPNAPDPALYIIFGLLLHFILQCEKLQSERVALLLLICNLNINLLDRPSSLATLAEFFLVCFTLVVLSISSCSWSSSLKSVKFSLFCSNCILRERSFWRVIETKYRQQ
jgi:hypothetical protein